ncbi:MAG: FadR family transcriptional regulator [Deltaproteobacteria bacterium]|nr:FadR family transcriptional regulator [Deltaproteobacteria bacterium]
MNELKELFTPVKTRRTFEEVSASIKELILEGVLKPGDRLPSEIELARQFNVSRQTVREALRILELSGFISVQKGGTGGPLIKDTILNAINNLFLDAFRLQRISIGELTVARIEIEKVVLDHVVDNITEAQVRELKKNIARALAKIERNEVSVMENIQFHNLLAQASGNHVFVIVVGAIVAAVQALLSRLTPDARGGDQPASYNESVLRSQNSIQYHEELLEAIVGRQKAKARTIMENHLLEVGDRLKNLMDKG